MNELTSAAGGIPPHITNPIPTIPRSQPLGEHPGDREPIVGPFAVVEAILRYPRRVMYHLRQPGSGGLVAAMVMTSIVCGCLYGLVVGSFSMGTQLWAAPLKIVSGMLISTLICLPSLYIFTCLSGSQARLGEICGLLAGLLTLMTLLLIGFAPVAWLFSQSSNSIIGMAVLHLAFWFIATFFGLRFLEAGFSHSRSRSSAGLYAWIIIFILVALQMTTALRPIIGTAPDLLPKQKKFFLSHWGDEMEAAAKRP
jgi:hypothetical protein